MDEADLLQTLAEVGVAIAGFTGVVVVLGRRARGDWSPPEIQWLHMLLLSSLCVVFFALLPVVLENAGLAPALVWRPSAGFLAVACAGIMVLGWRRFLPHLRAYPKSWRALGYLSSVLHLASVVGCGLVALGNLSGLVSLVYLFTLLHPVGIGIINFAYLLLSEAA